MHRIWDWIVGLTMIAVAIVAGGVVAGMIAMPVTLGLGYLIDLEGRKGGVAFLCSTIGVFAILQAAGFYDFYWRRRANYATGRAGFFISSPARFNACALVTSLRGSWTRQPESRQPSRHPSTPRGGVSWLCW